MRRVVARPRGRLYTPPVLRPADALVVERDELDRVELDDVEVGREVEVARRDQRLALAVEDRGVVRLPAAEPVDPALTFVRRRLDRGQDRKADVLERAADHRRADHVLSLIHISEPTRLL